MVHETYSKYKAKPVHKTNSVREANLVRELKTQHNKDANYYPRVEVLKRKANAQPHIKYLKCKAKLALKILNKYVVH